MLQVVFDAMQAPNPSGVLNLKMRRLKGRTATLQATRVWLDNPGVVEAARRAGAYWTLGVWRSGLDAILAGKKPHDAFGMARPGRRENVGFSDHDNLAAYVEHAVRTREKAKAKEALESIRELPGFKLLDDRSIRGAREALGVHVSAKNKQLWQRGVASKPTGVSDADVALMAQVAKEKFNLP